MSDELAQRLAEIPRSPNLTERRRTAKIHKVVDALTQGHSVKHACELAGISARTWRRWRHERPEAQKLLDAKLKEVEAARSRTATDALMIKADVLLRLSRAGCKVAQKALEWMAEEG
jgi:hypothetical protein